MSRTNPKVQSELCPECATPMPVHKNFRVWCSSCEWNLQPHIPEVRKGFLARQYEALGEKHGRRLYWSLAEAPEEALRPRLNVSKFCAIAISLCVYLISFLMAGLGVFLISWDWPNLVTIILGVAFLGIFWMVRARLSKAPTDGVSAQEFPELYRLVNRICDHIGTQRVSTIIIDEKFNAAIAGYGWRRQSVMWIGLPLWTILTHEERIALISHEVSHGANGDLTRFRIVYGALNTLEDWLKFLRPNHDHRATEFTGTSFGKIHSYYLMWIFSFIVEGVMHILSLLIWRNKQIQEYLADYLATKVSGTAAVIGVLHKMVYGEFFYHVLSVFSLSQGGSELITRFSDAIASLPDHEMERLKRINQMEESRLDHTHPPKAYVVEFLKNHSQNEPAFVLTAAEREALDNEMEPLKEVIGKKLIDQVLVRQQKRRCRESSKTARDRLVARRSA